MHIKFDYLKSLCPFGRIVRTHGGDNQITHELSIYFEGLRCWLNIKRECLSWFIARQEPLKITLYWNFKFKTPILLVSHRFATSWKITSCCSTLIFYLKIDKLVNNYSIKKRWNIMYVALQKLPLNTFICRKHFEMDFYSSKSSFELHFLSFGKQCWFQIDFSFFLQFLHIEYSVRKTGTLSYVSKPYINIRILFVSFVLVFFL